MSLRGWVAVMGALVGGRGSTSFDGNIILEFDHNAMSNQSFEEGEEELGVR